MITLTLQGLRQPPYNSLELLVMCSWPLAHLLVTVQLLQLIYGNIQWLLCSRL